MPQVGAADEFSMSPCVWFDMRKSIPTIEIQRYDSPSFPDQEPASLSPPPGAIRSPQRLSAPVPGAVPAAPVVSIPTAAELVHTGRSFLMIERHEMALPYFQQAIAADALCGDAWFEMGRCHFELQRYSEAENALLRATRLQPHNALAYDYLSAAYLSLQRWQHAVAASRLALEIDPDNVAAYNHLGLALDAAGRHQEAIEAYEQAIRLQPGDPTLMQNFMRACANLGRSSPAIR
jgi:tetratricopeptide (TPR) repeat protein